MLRKNYFEVLSHNSQTTTTQNPTTTKSKKNRRVKGCSESKVVKATSIPQVGTNSLSIPEPAGGVNLSILDNLNDDGDDKNHEPEPEFESDNNDKKSSDPQSPADEKVYNHKRTALIDQLMMYRFKPTCLGSLDDKDSMWFYTYDLPSRLRPKPNPIPKQFNQDDRDWIEIGHGRDRDIGHRVVYVRISDHRIGYHGWVEFHSYEYFNVIDWTIEQAWATYESYCKLWGDQDKHPVLTYYNYGK